jgi:hypothetical protein
MAKDKTRRRLDALEAAVDRRADPLPEYPDWPLDDQLSALHMALRMNKTTNSEYSLQYPLTARELRVAGIMAA